VSSGRTGRSAIEAMHAQMRKSLPLDDIKVCYHRDEDRCSCRKPKPGLINEAAEQHGVDVKSSFLVGDRWRDIEAGRQAGCTTILIDTGYPQERATQPDKIVTSLTEAVDFIMKGPAC